MNVYQKNGYSDRDDYLSSLADEYGIDEESVYSLASLLGELEDFDGLVTSLVDMYE